MGIRSWSGARPAAKNGILLWVCQVLPGIAGSLTYDKILLESGENGAVTVTIIRAVKWQFRRLRVSIARIGQRGRLKFC